jgi:hypothetical protein
MSSTGIDTCRIASAAATRYIPIQELTHASAPLKDSSLNCSREREDAVLPVPRQGAWLAPGSLWITHMDAADRSLRYRPGRLR